ncbi:virulence RhuM family protein [Weissella viridescens]|uniref:virulence RhuM family protein n=1 Tax=Weissella viridescens TaxID=1629 RepID=UPI003AF22235
MNDEMKFLIYGNGIEAENVDVVVKNETIWATQKSISNLFDVGIPAISKHLKNIFESGELEETTTISKMETVVNRGLRGEVTEEITYYNLDAIIAVGYRVNSLKATRFRQWATETLKEYMIKGFVLDDERLKQGDALFGKDYFKELLSRVRSIRASERRVYQQITDIFAEVSIDYDKDSQVTRDFYAMVQNKFHYAITGQTGAEIIASHADRNKPNMGLQTWKNSPNGRILKQDTMIAKNYLSEKEIKQLERTISSYFDYIESLLERERTFTMKEFAESIDKFLDFQEYRVLDGRGTVSMTNAKHKASLEYKDFNKTQVINSDFDKQIKQFIEQKKN